MGSIAVFVVGIEKMIVLGVFGVLIIVLCGVSYRRGRTNAACGFRNVE